MLQSIGSQRVGHNRVTELISYTQCFPGGSVVKNLQCRSDAGSIPGSGIFPGEENVIHSSILVWKIPQTDESGRLQSRGLQRVGHLACMHYL